MTKWLRMKPMFYPNDKPDAIAVPREARALIAIDLGAESCRVSRLRWLDGHFEICLVHRFPNEPIPGPLGLVWNIEKIVAGVEQGIRRCAEGAPEGIAAIGVDGWAVDYVRLAPDGSLLADPFCYRDERNLQAEAHVHRRISPDRLYELTGIQLLRFNTVYQLAADNLRGVDPAARWVNLPEYLLHRLGGRWVAEYSNATHTQLVALGTQTWCREVFETAGLDLAAAPEIVPSGTVVGQLSGALASLSPLRGARLIAPACHDTASAIAGIPATGNDWAFISSGTWSLVGTLLEAPCVSAEARHKNYTNLGGAGGKICFLKNVNGMWLIRQCMDQWKREGRPWPIDELAAAAENASVPEGLIDVDDPGLLLPGDMPARINAQRTRVGLVPVRPDSAGAPVLAGLIFHSLAARYAQVLRDIAALTHKRLKRVYIVGGGSRNDFLNRLTRQATGLEILRGYVESATIGNFAIQIASLEGAYTPEVGVNASAVAHWAAVLGATEAGAAVG
jgi:rhamnulokinase